MPPRLPRPEAAYPQLTEAPTTSYTTTWDTTAEPEARSRRRAALVRGGKSGSWVIALMTLANQTHAQPNDHIDRSRSTSG